MKNQPRHLAGVRWTDADGTDRTLRIGTIVEFKHDVERRGIISAIRKTSYSVDVMVTVDEGYGPTEYFLENGRFWVDE